MDMITHVADKKKHKKPRVAKKKNGKKIEIFCEIQVVYVLLFNYSISIVVSLGLSIESKNSAIQHTLLIIIQSYFYA